MNPLTFTDRTNSATPSIHAQSPIRRIPQPVINPVHEQPSGRIKATLQTNIDLVEEWAILLQQMKQIPAADPANKFEEIVEKIAQTPVKREDVPSLLSLIHLDNLGLFMSIPSLKSSTKTALLSLVAQILRFRIQDAPESDDPSEELRKSLPYRPLLPVMRWLFESQTAQLSQEDEESLASALMLFSYDIFFKYADLKETFFQKALSSNIAVRDILPAAWNRLAAFPLSQATVIPVLGLLALKAPHTLWEKHVPDFPKDADHCLMKRWNTVTDPKTCQILLSELTRVKQMWFFPSLPAYLYCDLLDLFKKGVTVRDRTSYTRSLIGLGTLVHRQLHLGFRPLSMELCFRSNIQSHEHFQHLFKEIHICRERFQRIYYVALILACQNSKETLGPLLNLLGETSQVVPRSDTAAAYLNRLMQNLSQRRLSLEELANVFLLIDTFGSHQEVREPLLRLIQNFDGELRASKPLAYPIILDKLIGIITKCAYKPEEVERLFQHLIDHFLMTQPNAKDVYAVFSSLRVLFRFKGHIFTPTAADLLLSFYRQQAKDTFTDFHTCYSLLVAALFIPRDVYQRLAVEHLQIPDDRSLNPDLIDRHVLDRLERTVEDRTLNRYPLYWDTFCLLTDCLQTSTLSPDCAQSIFSSLLFHVCCQEALRDSLSAQFHDMILQLSLADRLPPLTPDAVLDLKAWIEDLRVFSFESFKKFAENPTLQKVLPIDSYHYANRISNFLNNLDVLDEEDITYIVTEWQAILYFVEEGYLNGIDAASSLRLQESLCNYLRRFLVDNDATGELMANVYKAICAFSKQGCLDAFSSVSQKTEFDQLCKRIEKKDTTGRKLP